MKKIKTVLTAIVMLLSFSSFAKGPGPEKVTAVVKAAFESDFTKASGVSWEKTDEFYFASFLLNNISAQAAYTETGELVGTSRSIAPAQLPLNVSLAIAENYKGYQVNENVIELNFAAVTRYYITVSNNTEVLKLKCFNNGEIEVESKTKK